jgi:cation transport regulator ChaB
MSDTPKPELTIDMLASDIRQLAYEVNNIAITTSALVELLSVDKDKLKNTAQMIFEAAVANAAEQQKEDDASEDDTADQESSLTQESINASGPASHPDNAVIFGD